MKRKLIGIFGVSWLITAMLFQLQWALLPVLRTAQGAAVEPVTSMQVFDERNTAEPVAVINSEDSNRTPTLSGEPLRLLVQRHIHTGAHLETEGSPSEADASDASGSATPIIERIQAIPVRLVTVDAATVATVPVGSVVRNYVDSDEESCLYLADRSVFPTTVIGGDFGYVIIDPAPPAGTEIVANPLDVISGPLCGR